MIYTTYCTHKKCVVDMLYYLAKRPKFLDKFGKIDI